MSLQFVVAFYARSIVASSGSGDFEALDNVYLIFAPGSKDGSEECVNVTVIPDDLVECQEEFFVQLTLNTIKDSLTLGNDTTLVSLVDSDGK